MKTGSRRDVLCIRPPQILNQKNRSVDGLKIIITPFTKAPHYGHQSKIATVESCFRSMCTFCTMKWGIRYSENYQEKTRRANTRKAI